MLYKSKHAAARPNARCDLSGCGRNLRACVRSHIPPDGADFPPNHIAPGKLRESPPEIPPKLENTRETHAKHTRRTHYARKKRGIRAKFWNDPENFAPPRSIGIQISEARNTANSPKSFPKIGERTQNTRDARKTYAKSGISPPNSGTIPKISRPLGR